jgi:hypothetical protein
MTKFFSFNDVQPLRSWPEFQIPQESPGCNPELFMVKSPLGVWWYMSFAFWAFLFILKTSNDVNLLVITQIYCGREVSENIKRFFTFAGCCSE